MKEVRYIESACQISISRETNYGSRLKLPDRLTDTRNEQTHNVRDIAIQGMQF